MAHRLTVTTVATHYVRSSRVRVHIFTRWSSLQDPNANTLLPLAVAGSSSGCVWHSQAPVLVLVPAGGDLVQSPKRQLSDWPPPFCPPYDQTIVMLHPPASGGCLSADCPKRHRSFTSGLMECSSKKDVAPMWRKQSSFLSGFSQAQSSPVPLAHAPSLSSPLHCLTCCSPLPPVLLLWLVRSQDKEHRWRAQWGTWCLLSASFLQWETFFPHVLSWGQVCYF